MPFGLTNLGATFQRAMDTAFGELINKVILIYLDDLTVFTRMMEEHFDALEAVFTKCQEFRISLSLKKSIFGIPQGKLPRHVVSKEGVSIDPKRVRTILELPPLVNKK
ncbi:hypothetical protein KI387_024047, partial [Taxus chinensis]